MGTRSGMNPLPWQTAGTAPDEPGAYENRGSFHRVWNRFLLEGGAFALVAGLRMETKKANRYRRDRLRPTAGRQVERACGPFTTI